MLAAHVLCALLGAAATSSWPGALEADAQAIAKLPTTQRLRALEALTARAGAAALPLLPPLLADSNPLVRQFAARRLARAGHPAALDAATRWIVTPAVPLADRGLGLDVLREAPSLTPAARQAVERALRDSDGAIRVAALETLERHDVGPSLAPVIAALDDDNREVRLRAVRLAGVGGRRARACCRCSAVWRTAIARSGWRRFARWAATRARRPRCCGWRAKGPTTRAPPRSTRSARRASRRRCRT